MIEKARRLIWGYLAVLLLMLAVYKWQILPFPQQSYLLLLNINLIAASLLSCGVVFCAARVDRRWWLWFATIFLLFVGEVAFFGLEFLFTDVGNDELQITLPTAIWLVARIVLLGVLARQLIFAPRQGGFGLSRTLLAALGFSAVVLFTAVGLVDPLLREFGSPVVVPAPLAFLFVNLAAFALIALILSKGMPLAPRGNAFLFWPLIGFALYLTADLFCFLDVIRHTDNFRLWEIGYFCGYLLPAQGALDALSRADEIMVRSG